MTFLKKLFARKVTVDDVIANLDLIPSVVLTKYVLDTLTVRSKVIDRLLAENYVYSEPLTEYNAVEFELTRIIGTTYSSSMSNLIKGFESIDQSGEKNPIKIKSKQREVVRSVIKSVARTDEEYVVELVKRFRKLI